MLFLLNFFINAIFIECLCDEDRAWFQIEVDSYEGFMEWF